MTPTPEAKATDGLVEALRPCPFCGGRAEIEPKNWSGRDFIGVFCTECMIFQDSRCPNDADAVAAWNTRTIQEDEGWRPISEARTLFDAGVEWGSKDLYLRGSTTDTDAFQDAVARAIYNPKHGHALSFDDAMQMNAVWYQDAVAKAEKLSALPAAPQGQSDHE